MEVKERGMKFDGAKQRWSLLPAGTVKQIIAVLEFGAVAQAPAGMFGAAAPAAPAMPMGLPPFMQS